MPNAARGITRPPRPAALPALALVAVGVLGLGACTRVSPEITDAAAVECPSQSDCYDPPRPDGPGGTITVDSGEFFFSNLALNAVEGPVRVTLRNIGGAEHTFTVDEAFGPADEVVALPAETRTGTLELFQGSYTYYCSVPGHRQQGMEGTLEIPAADSADVLQPATPSPPPPGAEGAAPLGASPTPSQAPATAGPASQRTK
ncbi:MAG: cupredoxin domain-containing protein [Actinomycetota bacterium]|nr:cupredoxin domain-containing protein [Actinomycetota bacterium]